MPKADKADVALTLADRYGQPSTADFEEQFSTLRRNILELEKAAVARRVTVRVERRSSVIGDELYVRFGS